jgi:hypothetical protein
VQMVKDGQFIFSCTYDQAYALVERVLNECEVQIVERQANKGLLKGICGGGMTGEITVTVSFYSDGPTVRAETMANYTNGAFDTFGGCKKKAVQITDRLRSLSLQGSQSVVAAQPLHGPINTSTGAMPPSYSQRAGQSFNGRAKKGFWISLLGLLVCGPVSILGVIVCVSALNGMSTSSNKEGKSLAQAGIVIGIIAFFIWGLIVVYKLSSD